MDNQKKEKVKRNIENRFGMINRGDHNIEINVVKWNDGPKKLDIRIWSSDGKYPYKGITMYREEFIQFMDILSHINPMLIESRGTLKSSKQQPRDPNQDTDLIQNLSANEEKNQYSENIAPDCAYGPMQNEYIEFSTESESCMPDDIEDMIGNIGNIENTDNTDNIGNTENTDELCEAAS